MNLKIKKMVKEAKVPSYANPGDAGMDLYSVKSYKVKPKDIILVNTGIAIALPKKCVGLIWDKSGIATKAGLKVMGGVVDEGYRGEVMVGLINLSKKVYKIEKGDKVAQMLIQKVDRIKPTIVADLKRTARGKKGFGSSGKK